MNTQSYDDFINEVHELCEAAQVELGSSMEEDQIVIYFDTFEGHYNWHTDQAKVHTDLRKAMEVVLEQKRKEAHHYANLFLDQASGYDEMAELRIALDSYKQHFDLTYSTNGKF